MSEKVIGNQYLFNGPGYLDSKIQPVEHVEDLDKILLRQRFIGLTVTVIHPDGDDSSPADYWLVQDPNEEEGVLMWERKTSGGGAEISVSTNTPDYLTVTRNGNTYYVDASGNLIEQIDEIKSGLTEANERIDTVETKVETVETKVDTIETKVETVETKVETLETKVETVETKVESVETRVETVENEVSALTETITNEIETVNERIDNEVSALTETITNEVNTVNERIDSEVSALTETITNEVERIDAKDAEQDERLDEISQWHIEKLSEDSGLTQYALVDASGNTIGDTIDIIDEQYLESVVYIPSATEDDKAIDPSVIVGDPYLKFIWKYDIITYVAIKDWVNDYFAGPGISISTGHEISVKLASVEDENQNYLSVDENGLRMNMFIEIDDD